MNDRDVRMSNFILYAALGMLLFFAIVLVPLFLIRSKARMSETTAWCDTHGHMETVIIRGTVLCVAKDTRYLVYPPQ